MEKVEIPRVKGHSVDDALVDATVDLELQYPFVYADALAAVLAVRFGVQRDTGVSKLRASEQDGLLTLHWVDR